MQDLQPLSRASSITTLVGRLQSATTITRMDSADLPELTDPETIHKVVKKIRGMYGSCSTGDSQDIMHMLGSIQVCPKHLLRACCTYLATISSKHKDAVLLGPAKSTRKILDLVKFSLLCSHQ